MAAERCTVLVEGPHVLRGLSDWRSWEIHENQKTLTESCAAQMKLTDVSEETGSLQTSPQVGTQIIHHPRKREENDGR